MGSETFHEALGITRVDERTFTSPLHPAYHLWNGSFIHGGYSMAVAAQAMAEATGRPHPVTLTSHFMDRVDLAPVTIDVEVLRTGGRHTTAQAVLWQDDVPKLRLIGTYGDTSLAEGPSRHGPPPACPPWDECIGRGFPSPWKDQFEGVLDPATAGFVDGRPGGGMEVRGRMRFHQDEPIDGAALVMLSDVLVSPSLEAGDAQFGWIPTVELTVHVHDGTYRGEVLGLIRTDHLSTGYATEDVELWSADGSRFLAAARQLALIRGR